MKGEISELTSLKLLSDITTPAFQAIQTPFLLHGCSHYSCT